MVVMCSVFILRDVLIQLEDHFEDNSLFELYRDIQRGFYYFIHSICISEGRLNNVNASSFT